ncbi:MAG: DHH family phosphoesterase [Clostridia bacterium]|nr:DHH family phosphoesterase [Clostridia bacterium]
MSKHTKFLKNIRPTDSLSLILPLIFISMSAVSRMWWLVGAQCALLLIYYIFRLIRRIRYNKQLYGYLKSMTDMLDNASRENLTLFPMPITLLDHRGNLLWYNELFYNILQENNVSSLFGANITALCDTIQPEQIAKGKHVFDIAYLGKYYTVYAMQQKQSDDRESFYVLYWMDDDALKKENQRLKAERLCMCYIMIDSYDEIPTDVSEIRRSNFVTKIDVKVRNLARSVDGVLKKLETDKYLLLFERKKLPILEKSKFNILEEVKDISIDDRVHATLSIGVSKVEGDFRTQDHAARSALDMALSRGGDQVAVNIGDKYTFYGGKTQAAEKRKRVKVRIVAEAFATQVSASDRVLIMGHKFADLDCVGSAIALAHCVGILGTPVNIVMHPKENLVGNMIENITKNEEYSDVFIDPARAMKLITDNTLLVITDTHSLGYMESDKLYHAAKRVALIDHHRKVVTGAVENTLIQFHEPGASSCCEMVTELIDNLPGCRISKTEANCLMAGIILDTKNFTERTGVRTFEAAAYLKGKGADSGEVQKYFKSDIETYKRQLEIMSGATLYGDIMVATYDGAPFHGIKMIAGKTADELLGLKGVHASYVLFFDEGQTHISARAEGERNVQTVMEAMGGGGHRSAAGAQLNTDLQTTLEQLISIIQKEDE